MSAIETTYAFVNFRSRAEARWARFFDLCGWKWSYEPLDLSGYIPDFILHFKEPLLVEVKGGAITIEDLAPHKSKIEASGWEREALLLPASLVFDHLWYFESSIDALLAERGRSTEYPPGGFFACTEYPPGGFFAWDKPTIGDCRGCGLGISHSLMSYTCRRCGHYEGGHPAASGGKDRIGRIWADACNFTRWRPT